MFVCAGCNVARRALFVKQLRRLSHRHADELVLSSSSCAASHPTHTAHTTHATHATLLLSAVSTLLLTTISTLLLSTIPTLSLSTALSARKMLQRLHSRRASNGPRPRRDRRRWRRSAIHHLVMLDHFVFVEVRVRADLLLVLA